MFQFTLLFSPESFGYETLTGMNSTALDQGLATDTILSMRCRFLCIYCKRKKCRLLLLLVAVVSIALAAMVTMNFHVYALNTEYYLHQPDVPQPDVHVARWWPDSIKVKGRMATWHWSARRRGTVYKMNNAKWKGVDSLCKSKEKYIRHKFLTPGADVTVFFSTPNDFLTFDQTYKQDIWPTMQLMSEDSTLTFIDIGADDGVYSLVVAAMGNQVLAVEPNVKNVPKICQAIKASDLSGRCYVVANAVLDETDEPVLIKSRKGKSPTVYKVSRDLSGPGSPTTSIVLSDLLGQFPMEKVGIRFGLHHDVPSILDVDDEFFDNVDVQFIQMRWDVEATLHHDEEILAFMSEKGYKAYGYWDSFGKLEENTATWPENVIFRKNVAGHQDRPRSKDKQTVRRTPLPSKHVVEIEKPFKTGSALERKSIASKKSPRRDTKVNVKHTDHAKLRRDTKVNVKHTDHAKLRRDTKVNVKHADHVKLRRDTKVKVKHTDPRKRRLGQDLERLQYRSPAYQMVVERMRKRHGVPPVKSQKLDDSRRSSTKSKRDSRHDAVDPRHDAARHSGHDETTFRADLKTIDGSKRRLKPGDVRARGSPVARVHSKSIPTGPRDNTGTLA